MKSWLRRDNSKGVLRQFVFFLKFFISLHESLSLISCMSSVVLAFHKYVCCSKQNILTIMPWFVQGWSICQARYLWDGKFQPPNYSSCLSVIPKAVIWCQNSIWDPWYTTARGLWTPQKRGEKYEPGWEHFYQMKTICVFLGKPPNLSMWAPQVCGTQKAFDLQHGWSKNQTMVVVVGGRHHL